MATSETAKALATVIQKVDDLACDVKEIRTKLWGNGAPGIIVDQVNQNSKIEKLLELGRLNTESITKLKTETEDSISELQNSTTAKIDAFNKQTPKEWILKNWKSLALAIVAIFVFLHSVMPSDFSLWSFISKIIGGG